MKIACSSCGSKYTIADAKIQGKKVKVRCKSCKESILVDGTQPFTSSDDDSDPEQTSSPDASLPPAPTEMGGVQAMSDMWSVNLSDDDSREMTVDQLVAAWKNGTVTSDAYVWKDGMGDWKPILEVGELKMKLSAPGDKPGIAPAGAGKALPKAKSSNDLFGALDPGPSAPVGGYGAAKPVEVKPTGSRNDSSVLFSLDSLSSPDSAGGKSSEVNLFGDLGTAARPLLTDTDLLLAPPKDPPPAPVGARVPYAMPAAQAQMTPQKKGSKGLLMGAVGGALLVVAGGVFALSGGDDKVEAEQESQQVQAKAEETEQAKKALEEERKKLQAEQEKMKAELEKAQKEAAEAKAKEAAPAPDANQKDKPTEETKPSGASAPSPSTSPAPAKPSSSAPGPFSVAAAKSALGSAAAQAASCGKPGGPTGSGKVQVTFSTSGRVTTANVVSGPFGGTSVGGCVASTFRRAKVPAFSGSPQTVSKSFSIR